MSTTKDTSEVIGTDPVDTTVAESVRPQQEHQPPPSERQPGMLRGAVWLTVHTREAVRLVKGRQRTRKKPAIIGLLGYARLVREIWAADRLDDPYAAYWLLKVQATLDEAQSYLNDERVTLEQRIAEVDTFTIEPAVSVNPFVLPLKFNNPYAFRGARLLSEYDSLVRQLRSAAYVGLVGSADVAQSLPLLGRGVRRVFTSPLGYHRLGITRTDVRLGTASARRARELMGEVPETIMTGASKPVT